MTRGTVIRPKHWTVTVKQTDLDILVSEGESSMLEYKESLSSSFARELVAFANSTGGKILLGVDDEGTVVGVRDTNELRARIQDVARNCDPPVKVLVQPVGDVIVVTVRESESKPVQCREGFFWRQGAGTQKLSRDEICDFFRREGVVRFDLSVCPKFRYPDDFDRGRYDAWVRASGITNGGNIEDVLVNIDVAERAGGGLVFRNAGVLLFAKNVRRFLPQGYVTCLLAKGTDKVHLLDRKDFADGLVSDIEEALRFVERNTRTAYRIESLRREEISQYPMPALREAITNAVMHRDYFEAGANVFVEIYSDRIEVSNPGGLPPGLSREELGRRSVRRNPLIADLLHRVGRIEKAGTGIRRMREGAERHGCPEPDFSVNGFFTATFWPVAAAQTEAADQPAREVAGNVGTKPRPSRDQVTPQATPQAGPQATPQAGPQATPQVVALLNAACEPMSRQELQDAIAVADRKHFVRAYLSPLHRAGWLEMTIPDKPSSPNQRYRTTNLGTEVTRRRSGEGS